MILNFHFQTLNYLEFFPILYFSTGFCGERLNLKSHYFVIMQLIFQYNFQLEFCLLWLYIFFCEMKTNCGFRPVRHKYQMNYRRGAGSQQKDLKVLSSEYRQIYLRVPVIEGNWHKMIKRNTGLCIKGYFQLNERFD